MTVRTAILTEIIAPYRIPVFNSLARRTELDLHVLFLAETDEILRQWRVYKDEISFSYQVLPSWRWRANDSTLVLNRGLCSALDALNPQVTICGGYNYVASWQALWWAKRHGVEFVLWSESNSHDARARRPWIEFMKTYFLRHCDRFVVPGKSSLEYLRSLGSPQNSIFTAPNAVDNRLFSTQAEYARAHAGEFRERMKLPSRYILFVGRLVAEKGVFDLLEAYGKLEGRLRSDVALVFAGDGVSKDQLAEQAKQIDPGMICFPGFTQREDLAGIYALAELLILPTHSDPWGLVVNEAMACGLPIVVTNVAGCSADLVEDGCNGFVIPPRDSEKLSMAIDSILRKPELQRQMRTCSVERIQSYSPDACAAGLAAVATFTAGRTS